MRTVKHTEIKAGSPPADDLAAAILELAAGVKKLEASRLNRKAILVLLAHHTKLGQREIAAVLEAIPQLARAYLK